MRLVLRDESLISQDENLVSWEDGNLLLSGTVHVDVPIVEYCTLCFVMFAIVYNDDQWFFPRPPTPLEIPIKLHTFL